MKKYFSLIINNLENEKFYVFVMLINYSKNFTLKIKPIRNNLKTFRAKDIYN
jgi:hypothetical protein